MKKLYVVTRSDLGLQYAAVQAGHGVAQWMIDNPDQDWNNQYLIYLSVKNEQELIKVAIKCQYRMLDVSSFREPDLDNALTSVVTYSDSPFFKKFKLLASN